jgi:PAS domain-containing protein
MTGWRQRSGAFNFRDITRVKRMEAERFARARELHTLVDHLPDVVVRYDLQLRRTYPGDGCVHARPGPAPPRRAQCNGMRKILR